MSNTRERLVEATADLFQRQGYSGTAVKQIVEAAGAPFGSMYHHFPDGKEELGAETIRWSGALYGQLIGLFFTPEVDPVVATRQFFEAAADTVRDTDYVDACPIATVALEVASTSEPLRLATAEVFEGWLATLDAFFVATGLTKGQAHQLSIQLFALLEGAFILARATRDDTPIRIAGKGASETVASALDKRRRATSRARRR